MSLSLPDEVASLAALNAPFGARTTYRVGGSAAALISVTSREDLDRIVASLRDVNPIFVLGNGSNTLVADAGFAGVVLSLSGEFEELATEELGDGSFRVRAGAALDLPVAARRLAEAGIGGFAWAVGVPGTFGGAAVMNAGGHGSDMAHAVESVEVWRLDEGRVESWPLERLQYAYRHSALSSRDIVVSVTLHLPASSRDETVEEMREIVRWRREHQPGGANAGSVFQNPPDTSAGALIEKSGLKGFRQARAYVSEKHANFIQADPGGSADDVWRLIRHVHDVVLAQTGVYLKTEIRFIGFQPW